MFSLIKGWLKHKLAGDELHELWVLKRNINDLKVWCSSNKDVSAAAAWLEDSKSYPCQYKGCHGSIEDVREYLRKLDTKSLKVRTATDYYSKEDLDVSN